jgi:hypothetical protein
MSPTYHQPYQPTKPAPQPSTLVKHTQYSYDSSKPAPKATTYPEQGQPMVLIESVSNAKKLDTLQSNAEVESRLGLKENRKKKLEK